MKAQIARNSQGWPILIVESVLIADCDLGDTDETEFLSFVTALAQDYELVFRIYRTNRGLRLICVSDLIKPLTPVARRLLEDLCCDPLYITMTLKLGVFTARLAGKARRMGIAASDDFDYYALLPKEQREWAANYDAVAINYKACEFLFQTSECDMPSEIANFITLHDERTKCFSDLPMA